MDNTFIDKLAWVSIKDKKLLMTLSRGKDVWYIPGGKREEGESDSEALAREVKEELDVEIDLNALEFIGKYEAQAHGKPEGTMVRITCYASPFTGQLSPQNEIEKYEYFTYEMRDLSSLVDHLLFDDLKQRGLID